MWEFRLSTCRTSRPLRPLQHLLRRITCSSCKHWTTWQHFNALQTSLWSESSLGYRFISPDRRALSSKPTAAVNRWDRQTDGQTLNPFHRPRCAYYPVSIKKELSGWESGPTLVLRLHSWWHGLVVSGVRRTNEVNARQAQLVPGWVTVFGRVYHLGM